MAAATLFCLPSVNESFSLVLMQSWLEKTPALVHAECAVTADHVRRANGGLYFSTYDEFAATVDYLFNEPAVSQKMGGNGEAYVRENFGWDKITARYIDAIKNVAQAV